jgi:hypothetical protein
VIDIRLRSRIPEEELEEKVGKLLTEQDINVLLTGPTFVRRPDGKPLCVYLPGVMQGAASSDVYRILHGLKAETTNNRGLASGTQRVQRKGQKRTQSMAVPSAIIGAIDPAGIYRYCRLTAWTGSNLPQWRQLQPFLAEVARHMQQWVPERYEAQMERVRRTEPEWVVPGTPFSTVTVNNSYSTGVHQDKGDLDEGFSTIACLRRGEYTGGTLCFPEYRVGVNMKDSDLLLMDAHSWHGNTPIVCACGDRLKKPCEKCGGERISVVSYYRTKVAECGTAEEELGRAVKVRERRAVAG